MTVAVLMTAGAKKDLDRLPMTIKARVAAVLATLTDYPQVSHVKALKGALAGTYRVRVGGYRILFTLGKGTLTVVSIDDRKDAY